MITGHKHSPIILYLNGPGVPMFRAIAVETQFADEFNLSDEQFDTLLQAQG